MLFLGHIDHVVVGISIDKLIVGINACKRRLLVNDDDEGFVFLGHFFLLEIERLLLILLTAEYTDLNIVGKGHGGFRAVAVGLQLPSLDFERDLVLSVGRLLRRGGDSFVVVEHDAIESVIDQVLELRRSLGANGVNQHAGIRVGIVHDLRGVRAVVAFRASVYLVVGVGVAVLHEEVMQREIKLVFPDVVGKSVENLSAFLVPDVG